MTREEAVQIARDMYCDDDLQIDDNPQVSFGDHGVWVAAWVWVNNDEEDRR